MFTVIPPDNKNIILDESHQNHRRQEGYESHDSYRPAERLKDSIASSLSQVLEQIGNTVISIEKNGRSAELATEKVGAANQLATERTAAAVATANASNFSNTQNLLVSGFKDGRFDAAVNTAALQSAIAECCCEVRTAIAAEACATRELVSSIDARRADRELVDSKGEATLLKLQLAQVARTTPVVV